MTNMKTVREKYISASVEEFDIIFQELLCSSPGGNEEPIDTDLEY